MRRRREKGSAILEFALVGTTLIFLLVVTVELSIAMWNYHTLQYATKQAGMYVQVHGGTDGYCKSNTCEVENAAQQLATYAVGIPPGQVNVSFYTVSGTDHLTKTLVKSCTLDQCKSDTTNYPNTASGTEFAIAATYQFKGAFALYAAGGGKVTIANPTFPSYTHATILY